MGNELRVGIVGVGAIATEAHIPNYVKRGEVVLVAFADPEVDRVGTYAAAFSAGTGRPRPNVYPSLTEMLAAEQLDAVSICTPNTTHVTLALEALRAGLHVLVEKPMATSVAEAEELVEEANRSGKTLMVGLSHRYRQDAAVLKRFVDAGELGDVYYAKTRILRRRGTPRGWFTDVSVSGGGPLMDLGVHALDLAWWMMGQPQPVAVNGHLVRGIGNDHLDFNQTWTALSAGNSNNEVYSTEDFAAAFIRFANGSVLELEVSWNVNGPQDDALKVELFGRKGGLSLDPLRLYSAAHGVLTTLEPDARMGPLHQIELDHFVNCALTGTKPLSDAEQGLVVARMLTAIAQSSAEQREIRL